ASRILVLFFFYNLGYTPFQLATIFVFYELFGIITNLVGGWLAARFGLKFTLFSGLGVQIVALLMLALAPEAWLVVPYVMASQALSGIAKDLTKMSSKSAVKLVVADGDEGALFRWVSILTGSKNALKGVGFFLGGVLLTLVGFQTAMLILAAIVLTALIATSTMMHGGLGTVNAKAKFRHMFSQNRAVNVLAAARIFLFASRDVWFVVGLPVFLRTVLGWSFWEVGGFLAIWVIGYGAVQASAPKFVRRRAAEGHGEPDGRTAALIAFVLAFFPAAIAIALSAGVDQTFAIVVGLAAFGVIFAVNSAVHSYLILSYSQGDKVAMNVGFYYMANAAGRLIGTLLSGLLYQWQGLTACLWASVIFVIAAGLLSLMLPNQRAGAGSRASLSSDGSGGETALTA
ncbi:MAG: organoarsenical effux MFS transporter ArsJ, partial [Solirubrobacteraceae bacterium]|nr:organoarsenical effux MFS transporter ArsJ [Solirubrobacteraceae bacterium]